ncbi:MAG: chitobiase/beta-hexosaminidase C-terminal domain-containing protein [Terracidiphilus sp.]
MFRLDAICQRPLRFSLSFLTLTLACLLLPIAALASPAPGTCDGMSLGTTATTGTVGGNLNGFIPFPDSNPWNTNIASAAVDPNSAAIVATWQTTILGFSFPDVLSPNFGSGTNTTTGIPNDGIPYIVVDSTVTPLQPITVVAHANQGDVVVAPFPNTASGVPIGGSANGTDEGGNPDCDGWPETPPTGDNIALVLDRATCWLYETYGTTSCNGQYEANRETIWDMTNGESRPWGWISTNTSGLPEFPGLVRYDEASTGTINHALAFTMTPTRGDSNEGYFVLPASYAASTTTTAHLLPMGARIRLKASTNISGFDTVNQAILGAMQNYGMILTDTGTNFYVLGTPDARWDDTDLAVWGCGTDLLSTCPITMSDFDVIDMSPETGANYGMDAVSAYTSTNPEYAGGHAIPVINSFTANGYGGPINVDYVGLPVVFDYSITGDSYDYIDNIGPIRPTGSGSLTIYPQTTTEYTLNATNAWGRASYTIEVTVDGSVVAAPVFNPSPAQTGLLTAPRTIAISTPTSPSATIYYTTDGTTPATTSTKFTGSLTVDSGCTTSGGPSETVEAIATVTGYAEPSAVSTATYTCGARVATPTFSPAAGTYFAPQTVTISDATGGATIYYTTNGSTPTTASTVYSAAISVAVTQTVKAIATLSGDANSLVGSAAYTIRVNTPTFAPAAGTYTAVQTVTISDATAGATIYYTIEGGTTGTTPTTANVTQYTGPITVNTTSTIEAVAVYPGYTNSAVATATYTINLTNTTAEPVFNPLPGSYATTQTVTISDATAGVTIYYTLTAGATGTAPHNPPIASTHLYTGPVTIATTSVLEALAWVSGDNNSAVSTGAYTLTNTIATPTFTPAASTLFLGIYTNLYTTPQTVTINDTTASVSIYYTVTQGTTGTTPTTNSTLYNPGGTGPFTVFSPTVDGAVTVEALAVKTGDQNSTVGSVLYYFDLPSVAEPTFSPGTGVYNGAQTVTISDATSGASVYYTITSGTTGTTPTTASTPYTVPISVTPPSVVEALGVKSGYDNSTVGEAIYSVETAAPTPTFSPVGGTYAVAQNVSIFDTAPSAVIYYTTDGTAPTTASAIFGFPIHVVGAVTPTTIEAIATATNYLTSAVGSATYTIPTPAALTTPTPGTQLPGTSVQFIWTPGNTAKDFELYVGSLGVGTHDLYNSGETGATTVTVGGLPSNGENVYVRLYYLIYGVWGYADYTYTASGSPTPAVLTTPTPDTATPLTGTSVTFDWTPGNIATEFEFLVGSTGPGSSNLYNSGETGATTATVTDLPSNGETVYVRLYWLINGKWYSADYTYVAYGTAIPASLTTPTPNTSTPLTGTTVTFSWTPGNIATEFEFWAGTTGPGSTNLYNSNETGATSATVTDLPSNGEAVYVRLYSLINGAWQYTNYTYVASGSPIAASLTTPTPNTTTPLTGTTVTFDWTPGNTAKNFEFWVGTTGPGSTNLYNSNETGATSATVTDLPSNGETVYVRLYSLINGAWQYTNYTYVASGSPIAASLTTPTPNTSTPLTGTSVTFTWTPGNIATYFEFQVGSTGPGSSNLYNSGETGATTATVTDLPSNGQTVYVRLYSLINGAWQYTNYTYVASGSPIAAALTTPTPNTTTPLTGTSVTFTWTPGNVATAFEFWAGTLGPGSTNLYNSNETGATSATVTDLPSNGSTVYVRLYSLINGVWQYTNYTYIAE